MKKEREEELKDIHAEQEKDVTDEKPKVEVLYVPKNCKKKSAKGDLLVVHYTGRKSRTNFSFSRH